MAFIIKTNKRTNVYILRTVLKIKKILRFYFFADSLEKALNNLIINSAFSSANSPEVETYAERICNLIGEKQSLSRLWEYLDGILSGLSVEERAVLKGYAEMRCGIKKLCDEKRREIKRVAVKFTRRARRLESFVTAMGLVSKYYCVIAPSYG